MSTLPLNTINKDQSTASAFYELLSSMRFAVSMLTVLGIASIIGTVLKQNEPYANYVIEFGQFWFQLFDHLGLYDVYHSVWFLVILIFLVLSTSLCVYRNTPQMLRELRAYREHATEKSLRAFSHREGYTMHASFEDTKTQIAGFLGAHGFRFKTTEQADGAILFAAKAGSYQRLGYIFTHAAIVIICIGGLMDGNVPFKIEELLGLKKVESRNLPEQKVPAESRLSVANLSFRANMTLSEGSRDHVAFMRMRDGYLVQELPFSVGLEKFRIEHYATGQPKSFESDLIIYDGDQPPQRRTISVNHPLIYKGIAIYQSDFQDGGSKLGFKAWPLLTTDKQPFDVKGSVFDTTVIGQGDDAMTFEFNDFRLFNILNLTANTKAKPHNVGPSVIFKARDTAGQAHEYQNYMQPLVFDTRAYFVSGMRATPSEDFRYLRIPADAENSLGDFMRLRTTMFDLKLAPEIAKRMADVSLGTGPENAQLRDKFRESVIKLLDTFSKGGYTEISKVIEKSVPPAQREKAAETYLKIIGGAAMQALIVSRENAHLPVPKADDFTVHFIQDSLNSMSDLFFYGSPVYLEMTGFEQRQASGLQLTRSPGKNLVYAGSVLLVLGIFSMIYIRERRIWMLVKPASREILFSISASRKNRDFEQEFTTLKERLGRLFKA